MTPPEPPNPFPVTPLPGGARVGRFRLTTRKLPRLTNTPPKLRLRLRTKLVLAMVIAALIPVLIVALLATRVILTNLETGLRDDAQRQLTVGLNLVLRAVERLGDETVQLADSPNLSDALSRGTPALEQWLAKESSHVPSTRLQLFDDTGKLVLDRTLGGAEARFKNAGVMPDDPFVIAGRTWTRSVSIAQVGDQLVMRSVSPVVDASLTLRGVLVLSTPLDGDFADGIKGALAADVMIGGPSGRLAVTFRSGLGTRSEIVAIAADDLAAAIAGQRVIRDLDFATGQYKIAITALHDRGDRPVGVIGVALDREPLAATKTLAVRTLIVGGGGAIVFALVIALFWSRRLGSPIARLHRGAIAVSRGDLDHRIDVAGGDELSDLASAFNQMTGTLKENQARLAARMREIVALHDAGRAVSSVIDLDLVSRKIVDAVARTFDLQLAALWLVEGGALRTSAARARRTDVSIALAADDSLAAADALRSIADHVRIGRVPLRLVRAGDDTEWGEAARKAGAPGPLVALPLDRSRPGDSRQPRVVGVLAVGRAQDAREFSEADLNLLTTFADQAGAAVENALLYQEVRGASEELEKKVRLRTAELTAINTELGRALADLRDTQAQLVLSERMAGLGLLVAGVAHEINSPTAAIRGSIDGLPAALTRVARHGAELVARAPSTAAAITGYLESLAPTLAERPLPTTLTSRKTAREIAALLDAAKVEESTIVAADLADLGGTIEDAQALIAALGDHRGTAREAVSALTDHVYLHRTASTVRHAIGQIQRIVGALKSYSHLDQEATRIEADVHEGLETTLALMHHALRDIVVERHYGNIPRVPVYVDELNQVWTNLISNAQQAMQGKGTLTIETATDGDHVVVRVIDDGPGVPAEVLPRIFEAFFTTKPKGEGTGLGLGIARKIVDKHGGVMRCESVPNRTVFEVRIPGASTAGAEAGAREGAA
ncbi:MAG: HAMP domain-containing protein [Deltaproteobacteria bacterium]|nr:HAMP domain-containing protein [Deltaproteobacteria bacterium]